ncbi:MAG: isochorismate synthase [Deltaproteobacteria bacterium]|nr:isochorismate synthase [Deltaproteobacteria bacterium]
MSALHAALGRFLSEPRAPRVLVLPAPVVTLERSLLAAFEAPRVAVSAPAGLRLGGGAVPLAGDRGSLQRAPRGFRTVLAEGAPDHRAAVFFARPFDPEDPRNHCTDSALRVEAVPWALGHEPPHRLPRWQYQRAGAHASLSLALAEGEAPDPGALHQALGALLHALETSPRAVAPRSPTILRQRDLSIEDWNTYLLNIHNTLKNKHYQKIVAARVRALELDHAPEPEAVFLRAGALHPGAAALLWGLDGGALVGATPETLVRVERDGALVTHALAGTRRDAGEDPEGALRASPKDLAEHRAVVEGIAGSLEGLCDEVYVEPSPGVRRAGELLHLETPVRGRLRAAMDPLEAVTALHPTPAVGALPREGAAAWLRRHEPAARGLYAGPVGWVELPREGEGAALEARVALRCALLRGARAYLYAGAGVMPTSRSEDEYAETDAKLRPMLRALGVEG